jgi:hypothetical protein
LAGEPAKERIRASNWRSVIGPLFSSWIRRSRRWLASSARMVREVLDHLAVPYQEQVVVDRQHAGDVIEKARMCSSRWPSPPGWSSVGGRPVERCRPGTVESMRWRTVSSGLQRNIVAELAEIQTPVVRGLVIAAPPFSESVAKSATSPSVGRASARGGPSWTPPPASTGVARRLFPPPERGPEATLEPKRSTGTYVREFSPLLAWILPDTSSLPPAVEQARLHPRGSRTNRLLKVIGADGRDLVAVQQAEVGTHWDVQSDRSWRDDDHARRFGPGSHLAAMVAAHA